MSQESLSLRKTSRRIAGLSILSLFSGTSSQLSAQKIDIWTQASLNGVYWASMASQSKESFITGMVEGFAYMFGLMPNAKHSVVEKEDRELMDSLASVGSVSDLAKRIDELYSDPSNARIPIVDMVILANRIRNKVLDQKSLENELASKRRKYAG